MVDRNGAPAAARHFLFINPQRISTNTLASRLFLKSIEAGLQSIAFTKARKITELIYTWTIQNRPKLREYISAYRAGYLPEERREIERRLFTGELKGVISTSALEMGIDIGELDVCILVGYPGTVTTTWQRGGRVGRQDRESLVVLIAQRDALDQYFMRHPEAFFRSRFESAAVDPKNKPILKEHLVCAAAEEPLSVKDNYFRKDECGEALSELEKEGRLFQALNEEEWHSPRKQPQRDVSLRSIGEGFTIFEDQPQAKEAKKKKRTVIGTVDGSRVHTECHKGAIYLHRANQYQVTRLDLERKNIFARQVRVNYYTQARKDTETEILKTIHSRPVDNFLVRLGELKVTEQVTSYEKRRITSQERLSVHKLDLPPEIFETVGLWVEIEDFIPAGIKRLGLNYMGGIHALEHGAIALFPLFALCDRDDVGGISYPFHPQVKKSAVFIYDGYPGGIGLSERCYYVIEDLLARTLEMIENCDCDNGCPSCVHSPKCGSGNVPLDKKASILVLKALLAREEARVLLPPLEPGQMEEPPPDIEDGYQAARADEQRRPRVVVFDIETRRGPEEVGGWANTHLMGLAAAVVWDSLDKTFTTYFEKDVDALIRKLRSADLVVGFNVMKFDYGVLKAYTGFDLKSLPTFDILVDIYRRLGYRLGLGPLAEKTLGEKKTADGPQSLQWVREGRLDMVEEYCRHDVKLTRDLFQFGMDNQYLVFEKKGVDLKLPVDWELDKIVREKNPSFREGSGK